MSSPPFPLVARDALASGSEAWISSPWRRVFPGCHSDATALLKTEHDGVKGVSAALGSVINEKFKMELDACIFFKAIHIVFIILNYCRHNYECKKYQL